MYTSLEIARRINDLLKSKGISQKEMLDSCSLNKNTISTMLSRGSIIRADSLAKIADYLDCSVDYLLDRKTPTITGSCDLDNNIQNLLNMYTLLPSDDQDDILLLTTLKFNRIKKENHPLSKTMIVKS